MNGHETTTKRKLASEMDVELLAARDAFIWSRRTLRIVGLWPNEINDWICVAAIVYTALHCAACLLDMTRASENAAFIEAMTEIVVFTATFVKLVAYRLQSVALSASIDETRADFARENYQTIEDLLKFLRYNAVSKVYVKVTVTAATFTTSLYYAKPIIAGVVARAIHGGNSSTLVERLPFHAYYPFEATESITFVGLYLYQAPMAIITIAGYVGTDCLFVTLTLHLCGQYAVLSYQIRRTLDDPVRFQGYFPSLMTKHQRLIRQSKAVDASFRALLLYQVLLLTFLLCFLWHSMISTSDEKQYVEAVTYFLAQNSMVVSLFSYCFIGECFIYESGLVAEALYFSRWYEMRPNLVRDIQMCLLRSQRPIELTAGKFFILSFSRFTEILKLSVAYLSFLRNFTG